VGGLNHPSSSDQHAPADAPVEAPTADGDVAGGPIVRVAPPDTNQIADEGRNTDWSVRPSSAKSATRCLAMTAQPNAALTTTSMAATVADAATTPLRWSRAKRDLNAVPPHAELTPTLTPTLVPNGKA